MEPYELDLLGHIRDPWGHGRMVGFDTGNHGDIIFRGATTIQSLAAETGKVLKSQGPDADPIWVTPPQGATGLSYTGATGLSGNTGLSYTGATGVGLPAANHGDIFYQDAAAPAALAPSSGKVLKSQGADAAPIWVTPPQGATGLSYTGATGLSYTGATGSQGNAGNTGLSYTGATGLSGNTGLSYTGATGIQGDQGDQGDVGNTGLSYTGATGIQGDQGDQGDVGNTGLSYTGATGLSYTGATGSQGDQGDVGNTGLSYTGATGIQGDQGDQGDVGNTGLSYTGATGIQGDQGDQGDVGNTGLSYTGATGIQGDQGDQGDVGNTGLSYTGATGIQGDQGDQGDVGNTGLSYTGATGIQGDQGDQGDIGNTGLSYTGATGIQGDQGDQGDVGNTGLSYTGATGIQGDQGDQGDIGNTGLSYTGATGLSYTGATGASYSGATGASYTGATGVGLAYPPVHVDYGNNRVGIMTQTPDRTLDVLHTTNPQIRLTHTDNSVYVDLKAQSDGNYLITPSGAQVIVADGKILLTDQVRAYDAAGLKLFEDGGSGIFVEDGGQVGIGTLTPQSALNVANPGLGVIQIISDSDNDQADTDVALQMYIDGIAGVGTLKTQLRYNQGDDIVALGYAADHLNINSSGLIGINTIGPDRRLDILDSSNPQLRLTHTDNSVFVDLKAQSDGNYLITPSGAQVIVADGKILLTDQVRAYDAAGLKLFEDGGSGIFVEDGGNVGIGVLTPQDFLDVVGQSAAGVSFLYVQIGARGISDNNAGFLRASNLDMSKFITISSGRSGDPISRIIFSNTATRLDIAPDSDDQSAYTAAMSILGSNGNVGINTTGPDRKLDILDNTNPQLRLTHTDGTVYVDLQANSGGDLELSPTSGLVQINPSAAGDAYLKLVKTATDDTAKVAFNVGATEYGSVEVGTGITGLVVYTQYALDMIAAGGNVNVQALNDILLLPNDNVGIDTASPDRKLDILDNTNPQLRLTHTDGSAYVDLKANSGGDLEITPSGGDVFVNGDVIPGTHNVHDLGIMDTAQWSHVNSRYMETELDIDVGRNIVIAGSLVVNGNVASALTPNTTGTKNLGSAAARWLYIYGNYLNLSYDITCRDIEVTGGSYHFLPRLDDTYQMGASDTAWTDGWATGLWNEGADFYFLEERKNKEGNIVPVDDLAIIADIKPSGEFDERTGLPLIDDNSLPAWVFSRDRETGEIARGPGGRLYLSSKMTTSLTWGAIRQLVEQGKAQEARIQELEARLS